MQRMATDPAYAELLPLERTEMSSPPTSPTPLPGLVQDQEWYRKAAFYEVLVASFADSPGPGVGVLQGITDRLA